MFVIFLNLQAEKLIGEMEAECDQKVAECKEESKQYLARVQEEHATLVCLRKCCKLNMNLSYNHDSYDSHALSRIT